jgi:hypothetical protein
MYSSSTWQKNSLPRMLQNQDIQLAVSSERSSEDKSLSLSELMSKQANKQAQRVQTSKQASKLQD